MSAFSGHYFKTCSSHSQKAPRSLTVLSNRLIVCVSSARLQCQSVKVLFPERATIQRRNLSTCDTTKADGCNELRVV